MRRFVVGIILFHYFQLNPSTCVITPSNASLVGYTDQNGVFLGIIGAILVNIEKGEM